MKILHLCLGNFFIDNYSYQENMLPKYHVKQGHEVMVVASLFTFDDSGKGAFLPNPSRYKDKNGFTVVRLAYKKPIKWNRFFRHFVGLKEVMEEFCPDVIFSHNVSYGDTTVVSRYVKNHPNVRLFADNHADYVNSAKNWWSKHILHPVVWRHYAQKMVPYMMKCYGVTPMRCRFLKEMYHIKPELVEYLPLGVDDELIPSDRTIVREKTRKELNCPEDGFLVFTGGKIDRLKNTHVILSALNRIECQNLHLVICGVLTPEMEYLKRVLDIDPRIHYLGWCNAEKVMNCMIASDLACFPGTHSTLWEQAVGVGLPSVFKRWPEMEHVNVNGNCVFVNGDREDELEGVLHVLLENKEQYNHLKSLAAEASKTLLYSEIAKKAIDDSNHLDTNTR